MQMNWRFTIFTIFRKLASYYAPYKRLLIADLICSALVAALALLLPLIVRYITGTLIEQGGAEAVNEIIRTSAFMLTLIITQTGLAIFYAYKGHDMGAKIERDMRGELFRHYQKLPFSFFDDHKVGQLMSRLTNDLNDLSEMMHHTPENIVMHGIQFFGSLIILFVLDWCLALVVCVPLILMIFYTFPFYRKMQRVKEKNREVIADVSSIIQENLSGIRVVKSFAAEETEVQKFVKQNTRFYQGLRKIYKYEAWNFETIQFFFRPLFTVVIVLAGSIWITTGNLGLADLLVFIMYAAYLTAPIPQLAFMVSQIQDGLIGFNRFREIMDIEPNIVDTDDALLLDTVSGDVRFSDVTFRYNDDTEVVLSNIYLDIKAGETIAVVGRSGIGKTTLCALIPRFYDVTGGAVEVDGIDIRNITQDSLRRQIGIVRQEVFLFAGTVMENIRYGSPDASEQDVINAAKRANAHEFIEALANGYGTFIGQRGVKLSGGQQQRISIARVFLKNPPILIFDEATSALDYESEKIVMNSLAALSEGRTTFIIAHRLSTIINADKIVVLEKEGIIEQGTHRELCAKGGIYARLYGIDV
jgi:ATP-binding cassette subfamily B protein